MKLYSDVLLYLLIYSQFSVLAGAVFMKCTEYKMHFQKVVNFRPPIELISKRSLLARGDSITPINYSCWKLCRNDRLCSSYVLFLSSNECYGFTMQQNSRRYDSLPGNLVLESDPNAIYFEKTCLEVPESCKTKLWAITKIPGSNLVMQGKKTISTLVTRQECAERCIFEKEFQCLSASFSASHKNNFARLGRQMKLNEIVGQCILSDKDKTLQPDAFRVASDDEEYIENQCFDRPAENENCSYELYGNSTFVYPELKYKGLTQKECQMNCSQENRFYCQGVTYMGDVENSHCFLHSEDLISLGPRSIILTPKTVYMRRVKCLEVSVVCSSDEMIIRYTPSDWFRGKIYASSHSDNCSSQGNGTKPTILRLPMGNEIKENRCGIIRAYEVKGIFHRTFISTLIVIQNNPNVQTQGDRLIKVGCILNNATFTNGLPDDVAVESSLSFTQTELPSSGSVLINSTVKVPKIYMQVVDLNGNYETNDVQIGQNLELQIIVEPPNSPYDIRAVSLVARSEHNSVLLIDKRGCPTDTSVFPPLEKSLSKARRMLKARFHAFKFAGTSLVSFDVIIHFCHEICEPVNCGGGVVSFGRRRRRHTSNDIFDDKQLLNVDFVNTTVQVDNRLSSVTFPDPSNYSAGKYLDSIENPNEYNYDETPISSESILPEIVSTAEYQKKLQSELEVPLNFKLHVRGPYTTDGESFIYGENGKILIAGIDLHNPEILCLNQSLLIALLIFWFIFQIILLVGCGYLIRRYKRLAALDEDRSSLHKIHDSLDYLDSNRRVRWADQGSGLSTA